ncbi:MAG: phage major capsid protein, partial [Clostridia bacterium]|nr:phage major capsid protein [Clostridia bacterium]
LDAYQRQLKRFNIKVSGPECDKVEKFFCTPDSAILFPEFISRAIKQGLAAFDVLPSITAAHTVIDGVDYRAITSATEQLGNDNTGAEGKSLRAVNVCTNSNLVSLKKYGRLFSATYESLRFQNLDVLALVFKQIGMDLAAEQISDAVTTLLSSGNSAAATVTAATPGTLTYGDLLSLWSSLSPYQPNVMIAKAATIEDILSLSPMQDAAAGLNFHGTGSIVTPIGAKLIICDSVDATKIIGLDKNFALQMIQSGDVKVEYDKVIEKQLDRAAISVTVGFSRILKDAVKVLNYTASNNNG